VHTFDHEADPLAELPPVKPPTGAFILQLFLVPSLIVAALFLVVGMFGMLADSGGDPQQYVQGLLHENAQRRWRAAHALANMLTADSQAPLTLNHRLTSDRRLAASLADTLRRILDGETQVGGSDSNEDTLLRAYLATALGMFDQPVGIPVLLKAAHDQKTEVRLRALESIARLADRPGEPDPLGDPRAVPELIAIAADEQPVVRKMCAYTMGIIGDERFVGQPPKRPGALLRLLADADADVSYNAAGALARMGRPECIAMLDRMLLTRDDDLDILREQEGERAFKTQTVLIAALESVKALATSNPQVDLSPLRPNVASLATNKQNGMRVQVVATEVQRMIDRRAP
jgi:HEAT repeat protein